MTILVQSWLITNGYTMSLSFFKNQETMIKTIKRSWLKKSHAKITLRYRILFLKYTIDEYDYFLCFWPLNPNPFLSYTSIFGCTDGGNFIISVVNQKMHITIFWTFFNAFLDKESEKTFLCIGAFHF